MGQIKNILVACIAVTTVVGLLALSGCSTFKGQSTACDVTGPIYLDKTSLAGMSAGVKRQILKHNRAMTRICPAHK